MNFKDQAEPVNVAGQDIATTVLQCPPRFKARLTADRNGRIVGGGGVYTNYCDRCNNWASYGGQNWEAYRYRAAEASQVTV